MEIRNQFNNKRYHIVNHGLKHIKFVDEMPLTISEMMRRAQNGLPLSLPVIKNDRITINDRFYTDDFDILDYSLRNEKRLSEEARERLKQDQIEKNKVLEERKQQAEELDRLKTLASKTPQEKKEG